MKFSLFAAPCEHGCVRPLTPVSYFGLPSHCTELSPIPAMKAGLILAAPDGSPLFKVVGRVALPMPQGMHSGFYPLLRAERSFKEEESLVECEARLSGWSLACITLSDKGAQGLREDKSGPAIVEVLENFLPISHAQSFILSDEIPPLRAMVTELAIGHGYDLICTTGGTGLSPRDITPEALEPLFDRRLPGFDHAMAAASQAQTPHSVISRAVAGTIGKSIIISLPGSIKAVRENLASVAPALKHALDKLNGDPADCGS